MWDATQLINMVPDIAYTHSVSPRSFLELSSKSSKLLTFLKVSMIIFLFKPSY